MADFIIGVGVVVIVALAAWLNRVLVIMHRERRKFDAEIEAYARRRYEAKHARGIPAPARPPVSAPIPRKDGPKHSRVITTAATLAPVIIPRPGTSIPMRGQPRNDPGPDTITFKGVETTGEIRAVTDAYLADMKQRCAVDRKEFVWLPSEFSSLTDD